MCACEHAVYVGMCVEWAVTWAAVRHGHALSSCMPQQVVAHNCPQTLGIWLLQHVPPPHRALGAAFWPSGPIPSLSPQVGPTPMGCVDGGGS